MVIGVARILRPKLVIVDKILGLVSEKCILYVHLHLLRGRIFGIFLILNLGLWLGLWSIIILNYALDDWVFQFEEASFFSHIF